MNDYGKSSNGAWEKSQETIRKHNNKIKQIRRKDWEYHGVKTKVTDLDMVNLHIDIALMNRDEEQFKRLLKQKEELERESGGIGVH